MRLCGNGPARHLSAGRRRLWRRACGAEFEDATVLVIRFPTWNVTCRWLPGSDLSGMICSCHAARPCEHRVAAVLAFQVARGARQLAPEDGALEASAGAARSREEVLESVGDVLREMVSLGLSRLSASTESRLRTLTVSAHGVDLPRLERMLHALADEVALSLRRDAQASCAIPAGDRVPDRGLTLRAGRPLARPGRRPPFELPQGRRYRSRRSGCPAMANSQRVRRSDRLLLGPVAQELDDVVRIAPGERGRI